jgi:hypothetical protein
MRFPFFHELPTGLFVFLLSSLFSANLFAAEAAKEFPAPEGATAMAHSHNDFAQKRPLETALEQGYRSIEVDVTDRWGEIRVSHFGLITDGSLKEMYLDRLQEIVHRKGSVHGDGKRFYLWVEVKPLFSSEKIVPLLRDLLPRYPMLAHFDENGKEILPGAVELILINSSKFLAKYFTGAGPKPACRGISGIPDGGAVPVRYARWSYLRWNNQFTWDGSGTMPEAEASHLRQLQARAHGHGLRTRYWNVPDLESFWKQVPTLPFDLVGTDQLASTMALMRGYAPPDRGAPVKWVDLKANRPKRSLAGVPTSSRQASHPVAVDAGVKETLPIAPTH